MRKILIVLQIPKSFFLQFTYFLTQFCKSQITNVATAVINLIHAKSFSTKLDMKKGLSGEKENTS